MNSENKYRDSMASLGKPAAQADSVSTSMGEVVIFQGTGSTIQVVVPLPRAENNITDLLRAMREERMGPHVHSTESNGNETVIYGNGRFDVMERILRDKFAPPTQKEEMDR